MHCIIPDCNDTRGPKHHKHIRRRRAGQRCGSRLSPFGQNRAQRRRLARMRKRGHLINVQSLDVDVRTTFEDRSSVWKRGLSRIKKVLSFGRKGAR